MSSPAGPKSELALRSAKPTSRPYLLADGNDLAFRIQPACKKQRESWPHEFGQPDRWNARGLSCLDFLDRLQR